VPTRRIAILDAAASLINQQGFSRTSVEELIDAAGLSGKSHFYHYFKSKDELGYEVLERQFSRVAERGLALLREPMIQPMDRLTLFIDTMVALQRERGTRHGSPFGNLAGELADSHEGFRRRLDAVFETWATALTSLLDEMRPQLRDGTDTTRVAHFIVAAIEGGMLLARVKRDSHVMANIGDDLKEYVAMQLR
jgi:TetR/AcrR family transcriptional repressor of nem operon